jgi:hypothetical protein
MLNAATQGTSELGPGWPKRFKAEGVGTSSVAILNDSFSNAKPGTGYRNY